MRPENFNNLPAEEHRKIIQAEITKIEKGNLIITSLLEDYEKGRISKFG